MFIFYGIHGRPPGRGVCAGDALLPLSLMTRRAGASSVAVRPGVASTACPSAHWYRMIVFPSCAEWTIILLNREVSTGWTASRVWSRCLPGCHFS